MPIRTYTGVDLNIVYEPVITTGNGNVSGTLFNRTFSASSVDYTSSSAGYSIYGWIDFTAFPSINEFAQITKIRCTCDIESSTSVNDITKANGLIEAELTIYNLETSYVISDTESLTTNPETSVSFDRQFSFEINYDPPITRAQLINLIGSPGNYPTSGSYLTISCGITGTSIPGGTFTASGASSNWRLEVTYQESYSWYLDTPTDPVQEGDLITIINPDSSTDEIFEDVAEVNLYYIDEMGDPQTIVIPYTDFVTYTPTQIVFTIPNFGSYTPILTVILVGGGTQFSGSVTLGVLITIYFSNPSGIYTLVKGKTTDSVYVRELESYVEIPIRQSFKTFLAGK